MKQKRKAGIILHPSCLPGEHGIGEMGIHAMAFVDYLEQIGASLWQILPLAPTGYGNSPYSARSTFAGNEMLISLEDLAKEGLISSLVTGMEPVWNFGRIEYPRLRSWKMPLLMHAAGVFLEGSMDKQGFHDFCILQKDWLDDYALFMTITEAYNQDSRWFETWDAGLARRDEATLRSYKNAHETEIDKWKVLQFFFYRQWKTVKEYANSKGIQIIGDIPIFVSADSVDTWTHKNLFKTDAQGTFSSQAGVPPDAFSETGQLWGMPVYDWKQKRDELFAWWTRRLQYTLDMTDIVRIDHFRGFQAYWDVPVGHETAEKGRWVKVPGKALFRHLKQEIGALPIIAEDLGVITPEVEDLRDTFEFPGMKILQFAFDYIEEGRMNPDNPYLPHNYTQNCVAYTGTHDNQTTQGWYTSQEDHMKDLVRRYFARPDDDMVWTMIREVLCCCADTAMIPFQDLFCLGNEARMNTPATVGDQNWSWRFKKEYLENPVPKARFREMAEYYGRI